MKHVLFAALIVFPFPALATVPSDIAGIDGKLKACLAKNETTMGMNQCNGDALAAADKFLTSVYKNGVDQFKHSQPGDSVDDNKEKLTRLIASERAWVAYKESDCKLQGITMLNGSGEGTILGDCLYRMTRDRAKSLDELLTSQ